ncbi:MAG TPA: ATP-binding protein [Candidatus Thermoplasmatota archaeon]|jgi:signal transduction histidine kinase|nr:ATP-binding protein [Candidatus Thermoplasmatota archaeon]
MERRSASPGSRPAQATPREGETPEEYRQRVRRRLAQLQELVENAAVSDFEQPAEFFEEDEFTELEVGISLVLDDLRGVLRENQAANEALRREKDSLDKFNRALEERVHARTRELEWKAIELETRTRELEAANAELMSQDKYKSDFLAAMSHELRTPLNAIIGYSELLQDHAQDRLSKRHQRALGSVLDAARHLLSLINDLLDLSKVSAGKMEINPGMLATRGIMEKVRSMVASQAEPKGLQVQLEIAPQAEVAYGDARRLEQCLLNLASNAVKFTPPGGRVLLAAVPHPEGVQFSVADTGPGISAEDQKRLFKEFVQLQDVTRREHGGTGLGLALTKRLVELHKGRIWVESEVGKGSAFHFTLPSPQARPRGREVLVVDDDPVFRQACAGWLRELGLEPVEAGTAESALAYLSGSKPSAVLLDINLPGITGLELAGKIRAHPTGASLPILFVTAVQLSEAQRMARSTYQGAWIPKSSQVREAVAAELRRLGLTDDAPSPMPAQPRIRLDDAPSRPSEEALP